MKPRSFFSHITQDQQDQSRWWFSCVEVQHSRTATSMSISVSSFRARRLGGDNATFRSKQWQPVGEDTFRAAVHVWKVLWRTWTIQLNWTSSTSLKKNKNKQTQQQVIIVISVQDESLSSVCLLNLFGCWRFISVCEGTWGWRSGWGWGWTLVTRRGRPVFKKVDKQWKLKFPNWIPLWISSREIQIATHFTFCHAS